MFGVKRSALLLAAALGLALMVTAVVPPGGSATIQFGTPRRTGEQTTTVKIKYVDAEGVVKSKTITAVTNVTPTTTAAEKRAAVETNVDAELAKPANQVNGNSLASTTGSGNAMIITPANDSGGNFSDAKIEKITTDDTKTGEKDVISQASTSSSLGAIEAIGDITGSDGASQSFFAVQTNLGTVTVNLTAGMRRPGLLAQLKSGLIAQGATVWVDTDRLILYILIPGGADSVSAVGAGSTDEGLVARCSVLAD
jgi:hypothetical protein